MLSEVYLFGELGGGYTQFPDDYTTNIFSTFANHARYKAQMLIHRNDNTVYYSYIRRLPSKKYFGMCVVVSGCLISDYKKLFSIFEDSVSFLLSRGVLLEMSDKGNVVSSVKSLYQHKAEVYWITDYIKSQLLVVEKDKIVPLPPDDFSINVNESKSYSIDTNEKELAKVIGVYPNVYLYKDTDIDSQAVRSFANILKKKQSEIDSLKKSNKELLARNNQLLNKQRNTKIVALLGVLVAIMSVIIYFKVINPSEVTKYNTGEFVYYGPLKDKKPNGVGVAIYSDDDKDGRLYYYGNFVNGSRVDSNAIMFYKDGSYFHGSMVDDEWKEGMYFSTDNEHFVGEFCDNQPCEGSWYKHSKVQNIHEKHKYSNNSVKVD